MQIIPAVLQLREQQSLHSTLAVENGVSAHVVAASLGHESSATTIQSYVKPEPTCQKKKSNSLVEMNGIEPSAS
jgi:hypothetical protein